MIRSVVLDSVHLDVSEWEVIPHLKRVLTLMARVCGVAAAVGSHTHLRVESPSRDSKHIIFVTGGEAAFVQKFRRPANIKSNKAALP